MMFLIIFVKLEVNDCEDNIFFFWPKLRKIILATAVGLTRKKRTPDTRMPKSRKTYYIKKNTFTNLNRKPLNVTTHNTYCEDNLKQIIIFKSYK